MEHLFSTELTVNGQKAAYDVVFENELYVFHPKDPGQHPTFSLKREDDEWHPQDRVEDSVEQEALGLLEEYLLKQH